MENAKVVAQKCTTCFYGPLDEDREPCRVCIAGGTFAYWKATNPDSTYTSQAGLGEGREIGHDHATASVEVETTMNETPQDQMQAIKKYRDVIRRLEEAERLAKVNSDEIRKKAIHKLLEVLRNTKPSKMAPISVDPLTCPIDELESLAKQLGQGRGMTR